MSKTVLEQHQVAGLDERERGFNRQVDIEQVDGGVRAVLRYEQILVATPPQATPADAMLALIDGLRARGYSQLRSRMNFRGADYLGTQVPWTEHDEPALADAVPMPAEDQLARRSGWIAKVMKWFGGS